MISYEDRSISVQILETLYKDHPVWTEDDDVALRIRTTTQVVYQALCWWKEACIKASLDESVHYHPPNNHSWPVPFSPKHV